jgi:hypothetical protein
VPKKANADDARLILQLYDLRRETEMRKAREWWATKFWPDSADDFMKAAMAAGTPESKWLRQVASFWEMAATLVVHGTLNEKLFLEFTSSGEMYFLFAKIRPFLKDLREKMQNPEAYSNIEKLLLGSKEARERLAWMEGNVKMRREMMAKAAAASH